MGQRGINSNKLNDKIAWILDYMKDHPGVSAVDEEFHDKFFEKFGCTRRETIYGAQPVERAMTILSQLERSGKIIRTVIHLDAQVGFPLWVYAYDLRTPRRPKS